MTEPMSDARLLDVFGLCEQIDWKDSPTTAVEKALVECYDEIERLLYELEKYREALKAYAEQSELFRGSLARSALAACEPREPV